MFCNSITGAVDKNNHLNRYLINVPVVTEIVNELEAFKRQELGRALATWHASPLGYVR